MAEHDGMAVVPARLRKPRDKADVEVAALIVQCWIVSCLRIHRFDTLEQLNQAIADLIEKMNDCPFRKLEEKRIIIFEHIDCPAMRP